MNDPARSQELVVLGRNYGICKFGAAALLPTWVVALRRAPEAARALSSHALAVAHYATR